MNTQEPTCKCGKPLPYDKRYALIGNIMDGNSQTQEVREYRSMCEECEHKLFFKGLLADAGIPERTNREAELYAAKPVKKIIPISEDMRINKHSLFLHGEQGRGKSVLAAQIIRHIMREYDGRCLWLDEEQVKDRMWIRDNSITKAERFAFMDGIDVVVLNDLGRKPPLVAAVDEFMDWCYENMKVVIVTSNVSLDDLYNNETYRRTASRLKEMCGKSGVLPLKGKDLRG
jgi:DNA replication protein DnaC